MLRIIALLTLALLSACASSPSKTSRGTDESKLVQVTGTGSTFDEAKTNGFNRAIEFVVGSVILTEKESKRDKLTRDDIINHSSGYVDNYTVLSETRAGGKHQVTMDVFVKHSVIANRILNRDKETTVVEGDKLSWQYRSYLESRNTGKDVYRTVLSDYPRNALTVKKTDSTFLLDRNNNAILVVTYQLDWNYNYLLSLNETLGLLADEKNRNLVQNKVVVTSKNPKNWFMGSTDIFYFNDDTLYALIYEKLHKSAFVYVTLLDARDRSIQCRLAEHDLVSGGSYLSVQGIVAGKWELELPINPQNVGRLSDANQIEVGITESPDYCENYKKR